jgi:hypothetical protein
MNNFSFTTEDSILEKCQCHGDMFELQRYKDEICNGHIDEGFNLTFWSLGRSSKKLCWKERWRWIWNILRTGNPWADGIIINNEQAKRIVEYINKHLTTIVNTCPICNTPEGEKSSCGYCNSTQNK